MTIHRFFITGVSSGFGRAIALAALAAGHRVAGTVRDEAARAAFDALDPAGRTRGYRLDVTEHAAIEPVVAAAEADLGPIDVLVNNAGYGHEGIVEESSLDALRRQFDVNVFGTVAITKAFLPRFRARRSGRIINITSMGGFVTMPGIAYYCGSKFAVEGFSEALRQDVAPFGITVTAVAPGSFRTDWAGRSMDRSARSIADYDAVMDPVRAARIAKSGHQPGDPDRVAAVVVGLADVSEPPAHLLLGSDALRLVRAKLAALRTEIDAWEATTLSTDG